MERCRIVAEGHGSIFLGGEVEAVRIGRMPGNDLVLDDPAISRSHARIFRRGAEVFLEDLGSRHGCQVNGRRIHAPTPVRPGERIQIGPVRLVLELDTPSPTRGQGAETVSLSLPVQTLRDGGAWIHGAPGQAGLVLEMLHELSQAMVQDHVAERLPQLLMERLFRFLGAARASLLLLDAQGRLKPALVLGIRRPAEGSLGVASDAVAEAMERREAQVVEATAREGNDGPDTTLSVMNVPLQYDGELLGVASFEQGDRPFEEADLRLTASLCNLAAAKTAFERRAEELRRKEDLERRIQEVEKGTRVRTHLLAEVSHEIRSPLTALLGFTDLALQEELPARARGYVQKIEQVGQSLSGLLNNFLDFSKAEAGRLRLEHIPFAVQETVLGALGLFEAQAEKKGIGLHLDLDPAVPERLQGDPLRLGQILINLVSNAVKFTERGEVRVALAVKSRREDHVDLGFTVADSGIGLNDTQLSQIFDPYAQGEASTARRFGGTGLGLPICKALIELMDGRLTVESRPGEGSRFHFFLRFAPVGPPPGASVTSPMPLVDPAPDPARGGGSCSADRDGYPG